MRQLLYTEAGDETPKCMVPHFPRLKTRLLVQGSGSLGLAANIASAVAMWGVGHNRYPLALIVLAMPTAWVSGRLRLARLRARAGMDRNIAGSRRRVIGPRKLFRVQLAACLFELPLARHP